MTMILHFTKSGMMQFTMKTFHTPPPLQVPPAFSVYRYVATFLVARHLLVARHVCWWLGTEEFLKARAGKIFRILSVLR